MRHKIPQSTGGGGEVSLGETLRLVILYKYIHWCIITKYQSYLRLPTNVLKRLPIERQMFFH